MSINEEWRDIRGYEGYYQVSNLGRVKSLERFALGRYGCNRRLPEKIIKPLSSGSDYLYVNLNNNGRKKEYVHRLVAMAFPEICGEYFPGAEVNHKDENKYNNVANNLEICDHTYNNCYGTKISRFRRKVSKPVKQYTLDGVYIKTWSSTMDIQRERGYLNGSIGKCCNGHQTQAYGFRWEYA